MSFSNLKNPIFVALDTDDLSLFKKVVQETHDLVGGFKIGPRSVFRFGTSIIQETSQLAPVFIDFKFLDIPSTMETAVHSVFDLGASFCTVHAGAGKKALSGLAHLERELNQERGFHILAVTILTSFDEAGLPANFKEQSIEKHVEDLVLDSTESGIKNFVCSPHELKALKKQFPQARFITPGIRPTQSGDDQVRTATYAQAMDWGASAVVIGRPVLQSKDPRGVIQGLLESR